MRKWNEEYLKYAKTPLFYKRSIDVGLGVWGRGLGLTSEIQNMRTEFIKTYGSNCGGVGAL